MGSTYIADKLRLGLLPMRHHEPVADPDFNQTLWGILVDSNSEIFPRAAYGSEGDVKGAIFWSNDLNDLKRGFGAWAFGFPAVVHEAATAQSNNPLIGANAQYRPARGGAWEEDERFSKKSGSLT